MSAVRKRVLSVGQCGPDHSSISRFLSERFDVEIDTADLAAEALDKLRESHFDLVLINRKLDGDGSDGLEILTQIKADPDLKDVPVMLVSNFSEAQQSAVAAGAEYGFGKAELSAPEAAARVARILE